MATKFFIANTIFNLVIISMTKNILFSNQIFLVANHHITYLLTTKFAIANAKLILVAKTLLPTFLC